MIPATVYMALSLNGHIARESGAADFVSEEEWEIGFAPAVAAAKHMIIGRTTYDAMAKFSEFDAFPEGTAIIVVSGHDVENLPANHYRVNTPEEGLLKVEALGLKEGLFAGGGILNSYAIQNKLAQKIIVDLEPVLIGAGKNFYVGMHDIMMTLTKVAQITPRLVQLHYTITEVTK